MTEVKISYNNEEYTLEELFQKLSSSEEKIKELQNKLNVYAITEALNTINKKSLEEYDKIIIKQSLNKNCCDTYKEVADNLNQKKIEEMKHAIDSLKESISLREENIRLKEENIILKREKELLKKNLELSEEIRNNSSERKVIELQEDKRELQYKIQKLEYELTKQTQVNVHLVQLLREKEE